MRRLLCWLNYHRWVIPAWEDRLRFCPDCQEWERKVDKIGGGMAWVRIISIDDFRDYAKYPDGR